MPFEVAIFRPPMVMNSWPRPAGGSSFQIARYSSFERSREPPLVSRSLPPSSYVTEKWSHIAHH